MRMRTAQNEETTDGDSQIGVIKNISSSRNLANMVTYLLRNLSKTKFTTKSLPNVATRSFAVAVQADIFGDPEAPNPITVFTDDEQMIRDAVRAWAREELQPVVRDMDNEAKLRPEILRSLFEQGLMGMEIPESKILALFLDSNAFAH